MTEEVKQDVQQTSKAPRVLLEILVAGEEKSKSRVKELLDKIQQQMNKSRKNKHRVRVLWYIDRGEKTLDEKKEWLVENCNCKYYVILTINDKIESDFIASMLSKIRNFESAFASMKAANIKVKGMSEQSKQNTIQEAEIVQDEAEH